MAKNLPGIFRNPINHSINNNKEMEYIGKNEKPEIKEELTREEKIKNQLYGGDIKRKISDVFASPNYVYKADVEITLKDKKIVKKIIGKNTNQLITIDNELINISDIVDIKLVK